MMERFWLRSYYPESDSESWSHPMGIHEVKAFELELQRKGHMTRVYTEAEMHDMGWFEQRGQ